MHHVRVERTEGDCRAIGPRARHPADADRPGRTRHVFNDNDLTERIAHSLDDDTGDNVQRAACTRRDDDGDRTRWIALRFRDAQGRQANDSARRKTKKVSAYHQIILRNVNRPRTSGTVAGLRASATYWGPAWYAGHCVNRRGAPCLATHASP